MKYIIILVCSLSGCSQSDVDFLNQPLNTGTRECIVVSYRNGLVWNTVSYKQDISLQELKQMLNYPSDIRKKYVYC